ncbi:hypothetical protein BK816_05160 [Boudabousia tangfeifanii]|uniref:Acid-resistance membrane protein n=1 Tax=Boudabousia tangfeifanii TaxID=1912795 RepID=A0A1D9MKC1_9ACTO|nr:DUF308 domain-containing protein [Boudabousia tangfeifanii]AOZ72757.1 hypothetical protein BK816_05160 [Boudabousia tangfeifanii]
MKAKRDWAALVVGILYLLTAFFMFVSPLWSLTFFGMFFSFSVLFGGIFDLWFQLSLPASRRSGYGILMAVVTIILSLILLTGSQAEQALLLPVFLAIWFIFFGLLRIVAGIKLHQLFPGRGRGFSFTGLMLVIIGILVLLSPLFSGTVMVYMIAISFVAVGISRIVDFFTLKVYPEVTFYV